jgi:hypothetical protein
VPLDYQTVDPEAAQRDCSAEAYRSTTNDEQGHVDSDSCLTAHATIDALGIS